MINIAEFELVPRPTVAVESMAIPIRVANMIIRTIPFDPIYSRNTGRYYGPFLAAATFSIYSVMVPPRPLVSPIFGGPLFFYPSPRGAEVSPSYFEFICACSAIVGLEYISTEFEVRVSVFGRIDQLYPVYTRS